MSQLLQKYLQNSSFMKGKMQLLTDEINLTEQWHVFYTVKMNQGIWHILEWPNAFKSVSMYIGLY